MNIEHTVHKSYYCSAQLGFLLDLKKSFIAFLGRSAVAYVNVQLTILVRRLSCQQAATAVQSTSMFE